MPDTTPNTQDSEYTLLFKILEVLNNGGGGGGASVTGGRNIGASGIGILKDLNGSTLEFKQLAAGSNITLTDGDFITISSSASGGTTVQKGSQAITNGTATVSVVFGSAFGSVPSVVATVGRNAGDDEILCNIDQDTITVNGFTAHLSASVPNANYKLNWMAS